MGTVAALIAQAVIFAAPHMFNTGWAGGVDFLAGVLIGGFWGGLYVLWRNVWAVALHHAAWIFEGPVWITGGDAGPEPSIVTLAVISMALVALLTFASRRKELRSAV